jgi:hypothetical protein
MTNWVPLFAIEHGAEPAMVPKEVAVPPDDMLYRVVPTTAYNTPSMTCKPLPAPLDGEEKAATPGALVSRIGCFPCGTASAKQLISLLLDAVMLSRR